MKLVNFAGASSLKKTVSFYHGDHIEHAPPVILDWCYVAGFWLRNMSEGVYFLKGDEISNYKHQWVIAVVKENVP